MADFSSSNYTLAYDNQPSSKLDVTEQHGRVRRAYAEYTLLAELLITETISMLKLPAGARVVDSRISAPSDGTTGQLDVGWIDNGSDGADDDGLFDGLSEADTGGGAVDSKIASTSAGYNKKFSKETEFQITALEATTASTGDTYKLEVYYIVD